jgi:hypothetical protein
LNEGFLVADFARIPIPAGTLAMFRYLHSSQDSQMAVFNYVALTPQGAIEKGTLAADSSRQARDELRDRGLTIR